MHSNMAMIAGNYRNCIYFKIWVRILPCGTVITQATKGFVSFSKPWGGILVSSASHSFQSILVFPTVFSVCPFLPFWPWSKCDSHSFASSFLSFCYSKRHFMHPEVWSFFFFVITAFYLSPLQLLFPFYQQIPLLVATAGLCHSLFPQHVAFILFGLLLIFIFSVIFGLVSFFKMTSPYCMSSPLTVKLQNASARWWLLQPFSLWYIFFVLSYPN